MISLSWRISHSGMLPEATLLPAFSWSSSKCPWFLVLRMPHSQIWKGGLGDKSTKSVLIDGYGLNLSVDRMVLLVAYLSFVNPVPKLMFLHMVFEGKRLQIPQLIERYNVPYYLGSVLNEGYSIFECLNRWVYTKDMEGRVKVKISQLKVMLFGCGFVLHSMDEIDKAW